MKKISLVLTVAMSLVLHQALVAKKPAPAVKAWDSKASPQVVKELDFALNAANFKAHPYLSVQLRQVRRINSMAWRARNKKTVYNDKVQEKFAKEAIPFIINASKPVIEYVNSFDRATFYKQFSTLKDGSEEQKLLYNSRLFLIAARGALIHAVNSNLTTDKKDDETKVETVETKDEIRKHIRDVLNPAFKTVTQKLNGLTDLGQEIKTVVSSTEGQPFVNRIRGFNLLFARIYASGEPFQAAQKDAFHDTVQQKIIAKADMTNLQQARWARSVAARLSWAGQMVNRDDRIAISKNQLPEMDKIIKKLVAQSQGKKK